MGLTRPTGPDIRLVRSWPAPTELRKIREPRGCVVDWLERIEISDFDYRPVRDWALAEGCDGVLNLEWDIAVSREDMKLLRDRARTFPHSPFVAPYRLYPQNVWAHGRAEGVPVIGGEPHCFFPCFGLIYWPRWVLEKWEPLEHDPRMTDTSFARWSARQGIRWDIEWDARPIHLHY